MQESNAEKLVRLAPKLTEGEKKQINGLFQAYVFRRSKTGEVWTTCCGVHKKLDGNVTDRELALLTATHTPAPDFRWGEDKNAPNSRARVECPWCGARAAVKEIQYTGRRQNLWEFRRVLALRQWRGALWACAYDCTKDYGCVERSTEGPNIKLLRIYRFRPGKAECAGRDYGWYGNGPIKHYQCQTAPGKGKREAQEAVEALAQARKDLALADGDMAVFKELFRRVQEDFGLMTDAIRRIRGKDPESAKKLQNAVQALVKQWAA